MTEHIESPYVILRNEISGVAQEYTAQEAKQWLEHPVFGEHLKVVRTAKPEVLQRTIGKDVDFEVEDAEEIPAKDEK